MASPDRIAGPTGRVVAHSVGAEDRSDPGRSRAVRRLAAGHRCVFSFMQGTIHPYYLVALASAIGHRRDRRGDRPPAVADREPGDLAPLRCTLAASEGPGRTGRNAARSLATNRHRPGAWARWWRRPCVGQRGSGQPAQGDEYPLGGGHDRLDVRRPPATASGGKAVMAIGGFSGDRAGISSAITAWVTDLVTAKTVGAVTVYDLRQLSSVHGVLQPRLHSRAEV